MLIFKNEDAHALVKQNLGEEASKEIGSLDFLAFPDLEEQVRKEVAFLQGTKTIPDSVAVSGWVYEVETGKVRRVE
jgi:carbonic anhydrase